MKKMKAISVVIAVLAIFGAIGFAQAAVITFEPYNPTVGLGEIFTLSIVGTDFDPATTGGGLTITWDPAILTLASADDVTFTFPGNISDAKTLVAPGTFTLVPGAFDPTGGNFGIADMLFTANGVGTSAFNIASLDLFPWANAAFADLDPQPTYVGGTVNVVPIPSALLLLGGGLTGLVGLRWRKRE